MSYPQQKFYEAVATIKRMIERNTEQSARDILDLFVRLSGGRRS